MSKKKWLIERCIYYSIVEKKMNNLKCYYNFYIEEYGSINHSLQVMMLKLNGNSYQ